MFTTLAWAPNGGKIALNKPFIGESDSGADIYLLDVATGKLDLFMEAPLGGAIVQSWSPNGKELAYRGYGGIWVVSVDDSSTPRLVGSGDLAAWSPDGRQLAIAGSFRDNTDDPWRSEIYVLNLDNDSTRIAFSSVGGGSFGAQLSWSPDGTRLAFARGGYLNIYVLEIASGELRQLTHRVGDNEYPTWSPDGQLLAYIARAFNGVDDSTIVITRADGSCSEPLLHMEGFLNGLAWSPDGKSIAYPGGQLYSIDIAAIKGGDFLSTGPVCPQE
jgi:TolB protein